MNKQQKTNKINLYKALQVITFFVSWIILSCIFYDADVPLAVAVAVAGAGALAVAVAVAGAVAVAVAVCILEIIIIGILQIKIEELK